MISRVCFMSWLNFYFFIFLKLYGFIKDLSKDGYLSSYD